MRAELHNQSIPQHKLFVDRLSKTGTCYLKVDNDAAIYLLEGWRVGCQQTPFNHDRGQFRESCFIA